MIPEEVKSKEEEDEGDLLSVSSWDPEEENEEEIFHSSIHELDKAQLLEHVKAINKSKKHLALYSEDEKHSYGNDDWESEEEKGTP